MKWHVSILGMLHCHALPRGAIFVIIVDTTYLYNFAHDILRNKWLNTVLTCDFVESHKL